MIYTWLITHCDGQGRIPGKPKIVKQQVVPFIEEITVGDVEEALELMQERQLITLYADKKGRSLIQVVDWWDWQTGLTHRAASHWEAPEGWEDRVTPRDNSGRFVKEGKN